MSSPWTRRHLLLAPLAAALPARAQGKVMRLPVNPSIPDPQMAYVRAVLDLALQRAQSSFRVEPTTMDVAQGRTLVELTRGNAGFDLMWTMTDADREASGAIPVRIPIDRGLMGWRLLLVRKAELATWRELPGPQSLRRLTAGQGHDWPDTKILQANGLPVATSSSYNALFRMLAAGRFDYFPRSILEIDAELAGGLHPELVIAPNLMIHYPAAAYFYVNPKRREFARDLNAGLEVAVNDGSLKRLHGEHFGALLRSHPIAAHRVLRLKNPLLPPATPLQRRELWLLPGEL